MAGTASLSATPSTAADPSAVVWINGRQALVATIGRTGRIATCEIVRGWWSKAAYLTEVVNVIGDCRRVVILGPSSVRLALEREYVGVFRRPDRLVDVEPAGRITREELIDRLRTLAA